MYQAMAIHSEDTALPMAAAFGRMHGETLEVWEPFVDRYITQHVTPWAQQFTDDLKYWCSADEDIH